MESKKMRFKRFLYISVITLTLIITTLLYVNFRPIKARAHSYSEKAYFQELNSGWSGDGMWGFTPYDYETEEMTPDCQMRSGNTYYYLIYNIPSDNPEITNIILQYNSVDMGGYTETDFNNFLITDGNEKYVFELGFYTGFDLSYYTSTDIDYLFADYYLPYKVLAKSYSEYSNLQWLNYLYYLDLTDNPYFTEGFGYLVVRYKKTLETECLRPYGAYPVVIPNDLNLNNMSQYYYDSGYSNGYDDGSSFAYDEGYDSGYNRGYLAGLNESSADYGIKDLLFTIFDAPFEVMYNLFSFTLFGTTMWTIIASLTTLLLVLWLIKRFLT